MDYTNSQLIAINTGTAKIFNGNFKIIHIIEIDKYQLLLTEINDTIKNNINKKDPILPFLNHELLQTQNILNNLKPHRFARSLDFIGSAWKWIAGNPDHDDFDMIKNKMNNVLTNNNQQVIINKSLINRINEISNLSNTVLNEIQKEQNSNNPISVSIQFRLRFIKEDLVNLAYSIHWAKSGIINSLLLNKEEIDLASKILNDEHLQYSSREEALDFADVKIITNSSCFFYVINIPLTTNQNFDVLLIKPVKKSNNVIEINENVILKDKNELYGVIKNCKSIKKLSICNRNNIINISNSTCVPRILMSYPSKCNKINNQHIPMIEEISEGLLLLNQFNNSILIDEIEHKLVGTFLLKFQNSTIVINNQTFISKEVTNYKELPAILQPTPDEKAYRKLLSLEMMSEIQVNNTNFIEQIIFEKTIHQSVTYGFITVFILSIILISFICLRRKKSRNNIIITQQSPDNSIPLRIIQNENNTYQNPENTGISPEMLINDSAVYLGPSTSQQTMVDYSKVFFNNKDS